MMVLYLLIGIHTCLGPSCSFFEVTNKIILKIPGYELNIPHENDAYTMLRDDARYYLITDLTDILSSHETNLERDKLYEEVHVDIKNMTLSEVKEEIMLEYKKFPEDFDVALDELRRRELGITKGILDNFYPFDFFKNYQTSFRKRSQIWIYIMKRMQKLFLKVKTAL
jgi:hypothetical protein